MDRTLIRNILEKEQEHFVVNEISSYTDFNKLIHVIKYDLIIVNSGIRGYNGTGVLETINSVVPGIPVVVVTPEGSEVKITRTKNDTPYYFVGKTNFINNLSNTIVFVLENQRILEQYKEEYESLKRFNRYSEIIRQIEKLVIQEVSSNDLLKTTCLIFNETALNCFAWIGLANELDNTFDLLNWPENKEYPGKQAFIRFWELFKSSDFFEIEKSSGNYFVCNDIFEDNKIPNVIINYFKNYVRSFVTFPILLNKKVIGLFTIQSERPFLFVEEDIRLLGELINYLSFVLRKIHDEKLNEGEKSELVKAKEKAEQADRLKNAFLMNISHEIRTPMNGILGFTELLGEENLTRKQIHDYIKIINLSSRRMLDTINNLISISKIEAGDIKLNESEEDLIFLLKDISEVFRVDAEEKGLNFYFAEYEDNYRFIYKTDKLLFKFIISNLLSNAIKFTHKGYIEVGYMVNTDKLEIFVKDTGIGIEEKKFDLIFEKFRQGNEGPSRQFEGSGLGLAIAKAYAKKLKGRIKVESVVEEGTVFYFTLPLIKNRETNVRKTGLKDMLKEKKIKTLIVEDDDTSAKLLKLIMHGFSNEILHVRNGTEAVNICLKAKEIDLIVMDLQMPGINGFEATRQIRNFNKDVVIIAQSAYTLSEYKERALLSGCNDFVNKPVKRAEFLSTIQRHF